MTTLIRTASLVLFLVMTALAGCGGPSERDLQSSVAEHLKKGDFNAAMVQLKSHLADHPGSAQARFLLGTTLAEAADWRTAELELRKAQELNYPNDQLAPVLAKVLLAQGQAKKVTDEFSTLALPTQQASAELKTIVATAYARQGQRQLAEASLNAAFAADPKFGPAKLVQARFAATDGDFKKALALIDEVVAANPSMPEAWQSKGEILLYGLKDMDKALEAYAKAIAIQPEFAQAHFSAIEIYLTRRDVEGARKQLEALRKVAPQLLQTRFVEAQFAYVDQDYARAKTLLQQLLKTAPDNVRLLILDGAVSLALNANLLAESSLGKAVRLAPNAAMPRKMLAQTHLLMGQHANALTDLGPLGDADRNDSVVLALTAQAYLQAGNLDKADEYYSRATKANPGDVSVRTAAALARLAKGDSEGAFAELYAAAGSDKGDTVDLAIISAHQRRGELDLALKAINALELKSPRKALPADLAGRLHLARNDRVAARKSFNHANELDPLYFPAVLGLAKLDVADKDMASARGRLEAVLKKNPRHSDARMALIELRIFEKAPKPEVAKLLGDLINADPTFAQARMKLIDLHLASQAPKQAVTVAQEAVSALPNNPEFLDALGRSQLAAGEIQQGVSTYNKLISAQPSRTQPLLRLADAQVMQGNSSGAVATLRRALDLTPNNTEINRRMMSLALASKQPEKAVAYAKDMQRRQPNQVAGYMFEAEVEATRKNWPAVITVLKTAIVRASAQGRPAALKLYAAYMAGGKAAEAEGAAASWMKDHPKDLAFPVELGDLLLTHADFAGAEKYFNTALKLAPDSVNVMNNLAWVLLKQHKKGALGYSKRALDLAPGSVPVMDTYAMALADDGQLDKAIEVAKQALDKVPDGHTYRLNLAHFYAQANKADLATAELDKLVALGPKFSGADDARQLLATLKGK